MMDEHRIVKAIIHPFLGVARVGNSKLPGAQGCFIGPEISDPPEESIDFYRDQSGALKRQAARFRIYGLDASNRVVKELTAADADITWTAHLCNRKGAWYQFQIAQDIPEAKSMPTPILRNMNVADRRQLVIDPGSREIGGRNISGAKYQFDTGTFLGKPVHLGEIRTDDDGRLLVLGGYGKAESRNGTHAHSATNNEGWYDDTSDGPVTATVRINDRHIGVIPAWVVVAPPNYAPMLKSVRTMWDRIEDVRQEFINDLVPPMTPPARKPPSFTRDIRPIFQRLSMLQWVNAGFAATFGWKGPYDFTSPEWIAKLASKSQEPSQVELRRTLYHHFRQPDRDSLSPLAWPWIYGESINVQPRTGNFYATLGPVQMANLEAWVDGNFDDDTIPTLPLEKLPLEEQRIMLDRAAMEFCIADVFEPGIELPWILRDALIYEDYQARETGDDQSWMFPRIRAAAANFIEPDYGAHLDYTPTRLLGQIPGSLTRWLAVPWQADHASCLSAYAGRFGKFVPTLWPARVPNDVITESDYDRVVNRKADEPTRAKAFMTRTRWQDYTNGVKFGEHVKEIADNPATLGLVVARAGLRTGDIPETIYVEHRQKPR